MTAAAIPVPDLAEGLECCFLFDEVEDSYEISNTVGNLPAWLRGSWYINGPACFERAGQRHTHWLDGDGMVCALHLGAGSPRFVNRFVRTHKWVEEEAQGRFLYRAFGTAFAGDLLHRNVMLESPVNVSVFRFGRRMLAFGEQSLPYEIDPITLETRGEYDFGGELNDLSPFSAHPKTPGELINFGVSFSASRPSLNTYEIDAADGLRRKRFPLDHPYAIHDFGYSSQHMLFFLSPLLMKFDRFHREGVSVLDALSWEPELGSRILVTPRRTCAGQPFLIEAGGGYSLHIINCFETSAHLVMDLLLLDAPVYAQYKPLPDLFSTTPRARPVRYIIDLATHALAKCPLAYEFAPDFPSIDPSLAGMPYSEFWMLGIPDQGKPGRKFFTQLAHGSWEAGAVADIYQTPRGEYLCGEPCFVANPADRSQAVILCEHFEPAKNAAAILFFDAFNVHEGPVAAAPLRRPIHPGFHSTFVASNEGAA